MLMWVMSDRAIPRSYRMMQGFGVHTFRFVNAAGESKLRASSIGSRWPARTRSIGTRRSRSPAPIPTSIVAICGSRSKRAYSPNASSACRSSPRQQAEKFSFDVLDATKLIPEELVPVQPVGRMVLNRNPDNFFAETEQVAFCTAHVVPGHRLQQRPAAGAAASTPISTRRSRAWADPTSTRSPSTRRSPTVHNNQRDGMHRQAINRGRVSYEPNSLGGGCPFQAGAQGLHVAFPSASLADKVRGKPEKFRRPLHAGDAVLEQPDADRAGAHRPRVSLRADQGAGAGHSSSASCPCSPMSTTSWPRRWPPIWAWSCRSRCRKVLARAPQARGRRCRRRCRCSRGRATAAFAGVEWPSWWPTASTVRAPRRCTRASWRAARCRASSADSARSRHQRKRRRDVRRRGHARDDAGRAVRRGHRSRRQAGRGRARQHGTRARVLEGSISPLQADLGARRGQRPGRERRHRGHARQRRPTTRACCCSTAKATENALEQFDRSARLHRHFERGLDPPAI